jgi:hypothetical protein
MNKNIVSFSGEDNPFLARLSEYLSSDDLEQRLTYSPLTDIDVNKLSVQEKIDLLDLMQEELFEPTSTALGIVTSAYRLIRRGYLPRDPSRAAVRTKTMRIAGFAGKELSKVPWFTTYAKGMKISGETGTGKSYELLRGLGLLPQVIVHQENKRAGWTHLVQIVWLYVPMSHDGSLGGLLLSILCAIDAATGCTSYADNKSLIGLSNEKLAVRIGIILRNHGVGVLVIDEIQSRNLSGGAHGGLAATFFLRLLNFGIPIILIGNPFGMSALDRFSQDLRRLGSGGSFDMRPMLEADFDWTDCLVPALLRYNVMQESGIIGDPEGKSIFKYSGGIRDYACRIRAASQRLALDLGANAVTLEHMSAAYYGSDFDNNERILIEAFRDKNPIPLMAWEDIRWKDYATQWGYFGEWPSPGNGNAKKPVSELGPGKAGENDPTGETVNNGIQETVKTASQRDLESVKRARTRSANGKAKQKVVQSALDSKDMRHSGLAEYLIAGFEALRGER